MRDANLIRNVAWSFHKTTGLPFDDLFSEAVYSFLRAKEKYKAFRFCCKLTTFAYPIMKNALVDFAKKQKKQKLIDVTIPEKSYTPMYEFFPSTYPEDIKQVIQVVLSAPEEFVDLLPKFARGLVFRKLRELGYSHGKAWRMIKNTQKFINQSEECSIII